MEHISVGQPSMVFCTVTMGSRFSFWPHSIKKGVPAREGNLKAPTHPFFLSCVCSSFSTHLFLNLPSPHSSHLALSPRPSPIPEESFGICRLLLFAVLTCKVLCPLSIPPAPNPLPLSHACEAPLHPPRVTIETTSPISICSSEMNGAHKVCQGFGSLR